MNKHFSKLLIILISCLVAFWLFKAHAATVTINWVATNVGDETVSATNMMYKAWVTKLPLERTDLYWSSKRWEAALLLKRFNKKINKNVKDQYFDCTFNDTYGVLSWDIPDEIAESCRIGLFQWYWNWKFWPNDTFSRWQTILVFARMIAANKAPFKTGTYQQQLNNAYDYLLKKGIITVDDRSAASRAVTRNEMYLMMYRIVSKLGSTKSNKTNTTSNTTWLQCSKDLDLSLIQQVFDSIDLTTWLDWKTNSDTTNTNTDTTVDNDKADEILSKSWTDFNVAVFKDDQVIDDNVLPTWWSKVILAKVWVRNNMKDNLTLNTIKFKLKWLVSYKDIEKAYLISDDYLNSQSSSFNSSYEATITARNAMKTIEAWKTRYYYIAVDVRDDNKLASNTFSIDYDLEFDSTSDNIWWSLSQSTPTYRFVSYETQVVQISWFNWWVTKLYVWDEQKLIWSFELEAWSNANRSTKDVTIQKIILTNQWVKLEDKINNVKFKIDWEEVSSKVTISKDKVVAELKWDKTWWYTLERWESVQVDIYADIVWWDNWDIIKFYLDEEWDLIAKEGNTTIATKVKINDPKYFKEFELKAWKIVISKSSNSPIVDTVAPNSEEVEVLRFTISNSSNISMNSFKLFWNINNKSGDDVAIDDMFKSIKLYRCSWETCSVLDTANIPTNSVNAWDNQDVTFKLDWLTELKKASDNYYSVKIKTSRFAKENVDFKFFVNKDSFDRPENEWTNENIDVNSIVWSADSNYWSIWTSNININYQAWNDDLEFVKWKSWATAWEFVISSNNIQDLKINQIKMKFTTSDANVNLDQITNVRLSYWSNTTENKDVDSDWNVTFDSLNIKLKKGEQLKLKVLFDIDNSFTTDATDKTLVVKIEEWDLSIQTAWNQNVSNANIWWLPLTSDNITVHWAWKLYVYKSSNQKDVKTLYDYNKFEDVFEFTMKSSYDDLKIANLYVVAYTWAYSKDAWTWANIIADASDFINQVQYNWWKTVETNIINWIAKFENLNDTIKANEEKNIKIAVKSNNIKNAAKDNRKVKFAVVLKIKDAADKEYTTKIISLSNWEVLSTWASMDWSDDMISKEISVRKTMIEINSLTTWLDRTITNLSEHKVYAFEVANKWSWKAKVKQFMVPVTVSNTWADLTLKDFKVEFTSEWTQSFKSWSDIKDNIEIAVVEEWTPLDGDVDWFPAAWAVIAESADKTYNLYVRFVWDYNNWIEVKWWKSIAIRISATISWADKSWDSVAFKMKSYTESDWDTLEWWMDKYDVFSTWNAALNSIIWTDNADSNSNTTVDVANWFEDSSVEKNYTNNSLSYKS